MKAGVGRVSEKAQPCQLEVIPWVREEPPPSGPSDGVKVAPAVDESSDLDIPVDESIDDNAGEVAAKIEDLIRQNTLNIHSSIFNIQSLSPAIHGKKPTT